MMSATTLREGLDIFVSSGEAQARRLPGLLPLLRPHGRLHLASSFLSPDQIAAFESQVDVLHRPALARDPYRNFVLFFIREAHRLASSRYLLKVDTDVVLRPDWFDYLQESLAVHPDAVLLGSHAGTNRVDFDISGPLVRERLGSDVRVQGLKVNGSFCLADLEFFRRHDRTLQVLHDLIYAFRDGRRIRESHLPDPDLAETEARLEGDLVRLRGVCSRRQGSASYDNLLGLAAHVLGAGDRVIVRDAQGGVDLPDKRVSPSVAKRIVKRLRGQAGVPWASTKKRDPRSWAGWRPWRSVRGD